MKEPILPFFRPLEKIEKVSDFYNNGHKNIRYCYRKGGGVQVEVAWCFSFVIMTLNIKCMDRAIFLVRGDYLAPFISTSVRLAGV